jgi:transmembrane sensor
VERSRFAENRTTAGSCGRSSRASQTGIAWQAIGHTVSDCCRRCLDYSVKPVTYHTGIGEQQSVVLADGSSIRLNAMSRLSVRLSWCRRRIELHTGEAVFDVVHKALRPFTVQARSLQIRDIGTKFTVGTRNAGVRVAVLDGKVSLKPDHAWLGQTLSVGEVRETGADGRLSAIRTDGAERETAWIDGRLAFDHTPLSEVVSEMERYHPVHFVLGDAALARQTLSGRFEVADLQPFLRAVQAMLPVRVEKQRDRIMLYRRR